MAKTSSFGAVCGIVALCGALLRTAEAANASNGKVSVTCDAPRVQIDVNGNNFDVFAPGYPDSFVTNVMVEAISPWQLVKPRSQELPLRMRGGDRAEYRVVHESEDAERGIIAFHNYYIKSDQDDGAKDIVVAAGASVVYTAYKNRNRCSSDWLVNGVAKSDSSRIIFNRNWWYVPGWFIPSMDTPQPGIYDIYAHDVQHAVLEDSGSMTVAGIKTIIGPNGKSSGRINPPVGGATWQEDEVVYAQPRAVFLLSATLEPGLTLGQIEKIKESLTWSADSGSISQRPFNRLLADYRAPDDAGTYVITASCGSSRRIILVKVGVPKIHQVSFSDNIAIVRDRNGFPYTGPDWQDDNLDGVSDLTDANADSSKPYHPVAYLSTKRMTATGVFLPNCTKVSNPAELISGYDAEAFVKKLRYAPNDSFWSWNWSVPVGFNMRGTTVTAAKPFRSNPEVGYEGDYELAWEVGFGESGTPDDGLVWHRSRSNHELYLTYKVECPSYETVFHISCTNARGKKTDSTVTEGVWSGFSGRHVKRKDGVLLTYYRSYNINVTSFDDLLDKSDGQCGAWATFFIETLKVHGIASVFQMFTALGADGFMVKTWSFSGSGTSGDANFPYKNRADPNAFVASSQYNWDGVAEVTYTSGTPGQNNEKPASFFGNHQIVYVPVMNAWYDPSYGLKHTSKQSIDNTLSGFAIWNGADAFFMKTNPTGVQIEFR